MGGKRVALLTTVVLIAVFVGAGLPVSSELDRRPAESVSIVGHVRLTEGAVRFVGAAPGATAIDMAADPFCSEQHSSPVMSEPVRVDADGGLAGVLVRVTNVSAGSASPASEVVLDQVGCLYAPGVVAVRVGQDLVVRNSDATLHNVRVTPALNRGFNLGQPLAGIESTRSFDTPEIGIPVRCDIHGWMSATLHVLDNGFFDVTGEDGLFSLPNLPPGTYEIEAWHPTLGSSVQSVAVTSAPSPTVSFEFSTTG